MDAGAKKDEEGHGESTLTVVLALAVNLVIAVIKAIAGLITGSSAMLSEAGHSVADTATEAFLLTALRRSQRPADRPHPFGYGKERYFWSLLAAVSIFTSGAMFAFYQGFSTLAGEADRQARPLVGYLVLAAAFVLESISLARALTQVRAQAKIEQQSVLVYLRTADDPTVQTVLYEDLAALVGLLLAFAGLALHDLTGSAVWDGVASLAIGLLLAVVAFLLGKTNKRLLIGHQADVRLVRRLATRLLEQPEVEAVVDILTMLTGARQVLLCARIDFRDSLSAAELEHACVRMDGDLHQEFPELDEIFLEPVPRSDPDLREKVLARYGDVMRRYQPD